MLAEGDVSGVFQLANQGAMIIEQKPKAFEDLMYNGVEKVVSGAEKETTNNRMELTAVIEGLRLLKFPCRVKLYSDSAYVVNAFEQGWIYNWKKNNWRTSGKDDVKNRELMFLTTSNKEDALKQLDRLNQKFDIILLDVVMLTYILI